MVASKYSICNMENNTWKFKLCSMFKHSLNGKDIMTPTEYTSRFIVPMENTWFYERLFYER